MITNFVIKKGKRNGKEKEEYKQEKPTQTPVEL